MMNSTVYRLLALAARAECDSAQYQRLTEQANKLTTADWTEVLTAAQAHRMAPLLYAHLQAAGVQAPLEIKKDLQNLHLLYRWRDRIRTRTLHKILLTYQEANIPALVLKGAALAHLIYPEPGLRPADDVDILVSKSQAQQAQALLTKLGFKAPLPPDGILPDKHLATAQLYVDGQLVGVEVHHNLFSSKNPLKMDTESLTVAPLAFSLSPTGFTAYTLGYEDMLWHLCQHLHVMFLFGFPRLIWLADIISFAERFATEINWQQVKERYPLVLNMLSVLHFPTLLSEELLRYAPIKIGREPKDIGEHFQGWPGSSLADQRQKGWRRILRDTFYPSEWWLRLYYGLGSHTSLFWRRWIQHPLCILAWVNHLALGRQRASDIIE
jgi:hypothetical protein